MRVRHWRAIGTALILLMLVTGVPPVLNFPDTLRLLPGQEYIVRIGPLFTISEAGAVAGETILAATGRNVTLKAATLGEHSLQLRILGLLPIRSAQVAVVPEIQVVPGGQSVGVLLSSMGLMVVRTVSITDTEGRACAPAAEVGIKPGDVILRVGATNLVHPSQLESELEAYGSRGRKISLLIQREGKEIKFNILPTLAQDPDGDGYRYMLGLYLREPIAGVGTLTFWEPKSGRYGALGHMITSDESEPLAVTNGLIVPSFISGILKAAKGEPGEKMGLFSDGEATMGTIDKNTRFGIFGDMQNAPSDTYFPTTMAVALAHEVKTGPAEILTVVEGTTIERFSIEILEVNRRFDSKGLVVRITDQRLLSLTNGIVQGMSGSPIIQNGKLAGALTHVYVHNPERGFGVLAEWMIYEAGITEEAVAPAA